MDLWLAGIFGCSVGILLGMGASRIQVWPRRKRELFLHRSWRELVERYGQ